MIFHRTRDPLLNVHHRLQLNWLSVILFFAKWKCLSQYSCLSFVYIFFASSILSLVFYVFFAMLGSCFFIPAEIQKKKNYCWGLYINTKECWLSSCKQFFLRWNRLKPADMLNLQNNWVASVKVRWRLL